MKPLIIAHRGDTVNHKENTIEGFKSALKYGADGFEFDTQLNKEEEIIVVHNFSFDKSKSYPLLEDVLAQFSNKGRLEIELKSPYKKSLGKIFELLEKYDPPDLEIVSSFMPHLPVVKKRFPNNNIGLIFNINLIEDWMNKDYINNLLLLYLEMTGANILHLPIDFWNSDLANFIHSKNFKLHAHLGKDYIKYKKVIEYGLDQCSLDDVTKIKELKADY